MKRMSLKGRVWMEVEEGLEGINGNGNEIQQKIKWNKLSKRMSSWAYTQTFHHTALSPQGQGAQVTDLLIQMDFCVMVSLHTVPF